METAIIYCRVSSKKQEKDGDSLERQERECINFCNKNNYKVIKVFKETFSGKKDRKILKEALDLTKKEKVKYFIIYDIDRFTRGGYNKYIDLKLELTNAGANLKDLKYIVGEDKVVIENDKIDLSMYDWSKENPNGVAEMMYAEHAKTEGKKILQRTIPKEILLEQEGYHVRAPNFGYINSKIKNCDGKKTIQVKDPVNGDFVIDMFNKRARGVSDSDICKQLNAKGFKNKSGKSLNIKYLQEIIKKPIYAGVICNLWNGGVPIRTKYEGLVSIDTWNKANKGKITIIDNGSNIKILYKNSKEEPSDEHIITKRRSYNPEFPFSKVLKCPLCGGALTGNNSRSRNGKLHYYYQCKGKGGQKHKTYIIKRNDVGTKINDIFLNIKLDDNVIRLYGFICEQVYKELIDEAIKDSIAIENNIKLLKQKERDILLQIDKVINFPIILESKNKELEDLREEIYNLENNINTSKNKMSLDSFKKYSINIIKHISELALQKENYELVNLVFELVFGGRIVYEDLTYQTTIILPFFSLTSQQKKSSEDDFNKNSKWHLH